MGARRIPTTYPEAPQMHPRGPLYSQPSIGMDSIYTYAHTPSAGISETAPVRAYRPRREEARSVNNLPLAVQKRASPLEVLNAGRPTVRRVRADRNIVFCSRAMLSTWSRMLVLQCGQVCAGFLENVAKYDCSIQLDRRRCVTHRRCEIGSSNINKLMGKTCISDVVRW